MRRSQSKVEITAASRIGEFYGEKEVIMTVTVEQLAGITSQHNEIVKRLTHNSLDPIEVKRGLQEIMERKSVIQAVTSWKPPVWWRTPEQQLFRARQLWPNAVLPEPPDVFTPLTESEVPLLHVPDAFDALWRLVEAPRGYTKYRQSEFRSDMRNLRLAPNRPEYWTPIWLAFDPEFGKGVCPRTLWGQSNLAASEVLSALIQFPDWSLVWNDGASAPNLSGYELKHHERWTDVPCLGLWDVDHELGLFGHWAGGSGTWACPTIRKY